ncbi:MAG: putative membrane protein [uncultured bacterium (gcode 4)]|uniref:Putative membrane protein n=1 Tax=uncultured bacterium (gcode 4) TaxID=1234023 RepID=K2GZR6_9BACT|nr:MAG: putative membrane protein [uncultured bacterium (gcode 4)]
MTKRRLIIWLVSFWIIAVLGFVGYMESVKLYWQILIVKVEPVDPRDLLRWDYVTLGFPFSRPDIDIPSSGSLYAEFTKWTDNRLIKINWYTTNMPSSGVAIRWDIINWRLDYWIEKFFVPETRWLEIENAIRTKNVEAEIAIDKSWRSIIKNILIDWVVWKP